MRIAWATDIHWEFTTAETAADFIKEVRDVEALALFLTGDISTADRFYDCVQELERVLRMPVYYVLGNHDYYRGSFTLTRIGAQGNYMHNDGPIALAPDVVLVGVDGWGDCGYGDPYHRASPGMSDWWEIRDLHPLRHNRDELVSACRKRGVDEALQLRHQFAKARALNPSTIITLTHVPPWEAATWHQGAHSEAPWLPWFSCKAVGEAIVEEAKRTPDIKHVVLCGHTHGAGRCAPIDNVECYTGAAEYGRPALAGVLEVQDGSVSVTV